MALITTGDNPNSWVTITQANLILVDVPNELLGYEPEEGQPKTFQLGPNDVKYLIEAHKQIGSNFAFGGQKLDPRQRLPFPRKGFMLSGATGGPDWFPTNFPNLSGDHEEYARQLHFLVPGLSLYSELPNDEVPEDVKEAAVILAALLKNGHSLFNDNKGDSTGYSVGGISGDNINAVAMAQAVFQRMASWGTFIGARINKAGGSRV